MLHSTVTCFRSEHPSHFLPFPAKWIFSVIFQHSNYSSNPEHSLYFNNTMHIQLCISMIYSLLSANIQIFSWGLVNLQLTCLRASLCMRISHYQHNGKTSKYLLERFDHNVSWSIHTGSFQFVIFPAERWFRSINGWASLNRQKTKDRHLIRMAHSANLTLKWLMSLLLFMRLVPVVH